MATQTAVTEAIFKALGRGHTDTHWNATEARKSPPKAKDNKGELIENVFFDYTDEAGAVLFRVNRKKFENGSKDFPTSRPDGSGGWVFSLSAGLYEPTQRNNETLWFAAKDRDTPKVGAREFPEARRVLWLLPDVLKAQIVHIHEGEKAAKWHNDELKAAGRYGREVATTAPHGAGKWREEYAQVLKDKHVIVWPDNDTQGQKHVDTVCASCVKVAASVKWMLTDGQPFKGDICERFEAGATLDDLAALCKATPEWVPIPQADATPEPKAKQMFPRLKLREVFNRPRLESLVEGIFLKRGTGVATADYGGFKSFVFGVDIGLSVATGRRWQGRAVKQGTVVYVGAEGAYETEARAKAWLQHHNIRDIPDCFEIIEMPVQVGDSAICAQFISELSGISPALIILDTVAKCNIGRDENDATAMGLFTDGMEKIARELNTFVLAIHHNNKSGTARGSVSLPANVDASITLKRSPGNVVTIRCDRVKGTPFEEFTLIGRVVELPERDEYGKNITSLVFERTDKPNSDSPMSQTDQTRERVWEVLKSHTDGLGSTAWQAATGLSNGRFYDYRKDLVESGRVLQNGRTYTAKITELPFTPITPIYSDSEQSEREFYSDHSDDSKSRSNRSSSEQNGVGFQNGDGEEADEV